jgi:hypothetical protein
MRQCMPEPKLLSVVEGWRLGGLDGVALGLGKMCVMEKNTVTVVLDRFLSEFSFAGELLKNCMM